MAKLTRAAQRAKTAERRKKAVQLRLAGVDWQTIADQLGYASKRAACYDITRVMRQQQKELAESLDELRETQSLRYERVMAAFFGKTVKGDAASAGVYLRAMQQYERLKGLQAAQQVDATVVGTTLAELLALADTSDVEDAAALFDDGGPDAGA
ncbi:hypothetical protein [Streptomyces chilikensis]|uniref:Uncharacterized protein n=1 Tax=Streptomyces chilikensis TaxID=1194079 RepID=A0ABV3EJC2_9ACTN